VIYKKRNIELILSDSRERLKLYPDGYFDAIITDPPYGVGFADYDGSAEIFFELESEFFRVLKKGGWFVFWWTLKKLPEISRLTRFTYRWQIVAKFKGSVTKSMIGDRAYAPILLFSKGDAKVKARISDIIPACELPQIEGRKIKQGDFKPTYTQALLLSAFAGREGRVLDPFAGFGSLLLASLLTGIGRVVGIEKDEQRFQIATRLLKEETVPLPIPDMIKEEENGEEQEFLLWKRE